MMKFIAELGFASRSFLAECGYACRLLWRLLTAVPICFKRFYLVKEQIYYLGNRSLVIIAISGLFVGFVMGLQFYYGLNMFGSTEVLGLMVTLSLFRELGATLTALLYAGRAGTALTAEIGLMRSGEQLTAMEMMAVDPVERILAPRFWAGVLVVPLLTAIFNLVAVFGSWLVSVVMLNVDAASFWGQMQANVDVFSDLGNGMFKSLIFGILVTFMALYKGYIASPTPEGVAQASTQAVVWASVLVLAADFILTALLFNF